MLKRGLHWNIKRKMYPSLLNLIVTKVNLSKEHWNNN